MIEQEKLLECMEEIKAIAKSQQGRLTKEEIDKYLDGMELDRKQMEAVYQYLCASGIFVEGYEYVPKERQSEDGIANGGKTAGRAVNRKVSGDKEKSSSKSSAKALRNLQMYQSEVSAIKERTQEQDTELMGRFLRGEDGLRNEILQGQLQKVIFLAKQYKKRGMGTLPIEEIIAEGNMGLMNAMEMLERSRESFLKSDGQPDMEKTYGAMDMEIKHAMESLIDDMTEKKDWEDTLVARTNLLHEAAKYLAEEMGRPATQEELSEYTRVSIKEIHDIMGISEEVRKAF